MPLQIQFMFLFSIQSFDMTCTINEDFDLPGKGLRVVAQIIEIKNSKVTYVQGERIKYHKCFSS